MSQAVLLSSLSQAVLLSSLSLAVLLSSLSLAVLLSSLSQAVLLSSLSLAVLLSSLSQAVLLTSLSPAILLSSLTPDVLLSSPSQAGNSVSSLSDETRSAVPQVEGLITTDVTTMSLSLYLRLQAYNVSLVLTFYNKCQHQLKAKWTLFIYHLLLVNYLLVSELPVHLLLKICVSTENVCMFCVI